MPKYIKKPVVIEAHQFLLERPFEPGMKFLNKWNICQISLNGTIKNYIVIETLEGNMTCYENDYVVCGVNGEYYPVKKDIFHKTYEAIEE